jgi:hypothetical protein
MSCWQFEVLEKLGAAAAVLVLAAATLAVVAAALAAVDVVPGDAELEDVVALDPHPAVIAAAATSIAGIALMFTNGPFSRPVPSDRWRDTTPDPGPRGISDFAADLPARARVDAAQDQE